MLRLVARPLAAAARARVASLHTAASQTAQASRIVPLAVAGALGVSLAVYTTQRDAAQCAFWGKGDPWATVRKDIEKIIADNDAGPLMVRLAWHASGTYDKNSKSGGSNGATMRFSPEAGHGANNGLNLARDLLEPIKAKNPDLSYADIWTFAGVVAVEHSGGPKIPWKAGRTDAADGAACPPDGRLPDAAQGAAHVRDIFYRMGFNDREIVALVGAHTLGMCHPDRSGFEGPWTRDPFTFGNAFFTTLLEEKWSLRKDFKPAQFENATKDLMMLPADLALIMDPTFLQFVELYAKDKATFYNDFSAAFSKLLELGVPRK